MQKDSRKNEERLLPFETIKAATEGDVDAMDKILKHYKPYIAMVIKATLMKNCESVWRQN